MPQLQTMIKPVLQILTSNSRKKYISFLHSSPLYAFHYCKYTNEFNSGNQKIF